MKIDGIRLKEGSSIFNLTVNSGMVLPATPNVGELFFKNDPANPGMFVYNGSDWYRLADNISVITNLGFTPVNRDGDIMRGSLTLIADPTAPLEPATKQYCDSLFSKVNKIGMAAAAVSAVAALLSVVALLSKF